MLAVFIRKEFYHILRDKRTMMVLLGMPIIQIILFGFAISTDIKEAKVAIVDPAKDISTRSITDRIDASEFFNVTFIANNMDEANELLRKGSVEAVIVFDDNFNNNLMHTGHADIQVMVDATNPNTATMLSGYATNIIASYNRELMGEYKIPAIIKPEVKLLYNPQMKSSYNFVPGVMGLILMLICAMMTSISIVREKETGSMEVLLVSPMKPIYVIVAKAIPYVVVSLINLISIIALSVYVLKVPLAGSLFWLMAVSMLFIVVALLLGLMVSTLTRTQVAAMLVSGMVFMIPTIMLSGLMFPIESIPLPLQWVSNIIPAKWYISAVRKLMIEGLGVVSVAKEAAVMGGMMVALILFCTKKFKNRLE